MTIDATLIKHKFIRVRHLAMIDTLRISPRKFGKTYIFEKVVLYNFPINSLNLGLKQAIFLSDPIILFSVLVIYACILYIIYTYVCYTYIYVIHIYTHMHVCDYIYIITKLSVFEENAYS